MIHEYKWDKKELVMRRWIDMHYRRA